MYAALVKIWSLPAAIYRPVLPALDGINRMERGVMGTLG
jgi:hypothetical protein